MSAPAAAVATPAPVPKRLGSLDAYRGFVMLLMAGEVLHFGKVSANLPDSGFWQLLAHHQDHVEWRGCVLHDLIQPSFSFLVGCALPWSVANRRERGQTQGGMFFHTLWRAFALVALGIILRSTGSRLTNFTFEDTLTQIGLGYTFLWLLAWRGLTTQLVALFSLLVGYWAWFAFSALPPAGFDPSSVGVPKDWPHQLTGFAAHWNKNTNPAHYFEVWFLNLFPRSQPFRFNGGGYLTLSFIPTLATMVLGLLAGQWLRRADLTALERIRGLVLAGLTGLALGTTLDLTGICPSVKRIWTPAWVLFSGGWCALFLAAFHALVDVQGWRRLAFPLVVVGMNSIFTYVIAHLWDGFFSSNLTKHLNTLVVWLAGPDALKPDASFWTLTFGPYAPLANGAAVLGLIWLCCLWLWRRQVFIRI
jgi:heparan-alpha-glucosaminide N-acetyltransferase